MQWLDTLYQNDPKLTIFIMSLFTTILVMIVKYRYQKWNNEEEIINSSKIYLCSFANILSSSIFNDNKSLATEHYNILLTSSAIFKKNNDLNSYYKELQTFYISLQINKYDENKAKLEKDTSRITEIITLLEQNC
jgi:hypothetical protein